MRCRGARGTPRGQGNTGDDPRAGEDLKLDSWRGWVHQLLLICSCCSHRLLGLLSSDSPSRSRLHPLPIFLSLLVSSVHTCICLGGALPAVDFTGCGLGLPLATCCQVFSVVQSVVIAGSDEPGAASWVSHLYRGEL